MNPFKHLLSAAGGHPPVGTWISSASPLVAEAVAHAGFEWGVIDMEHSPLDLTDVLHLLQAVSASRMVPVVRVPWNDRVAIKRVLDVGATTLLVPFVQSADEARDAVSATRYPPEGVRGMAIGSRASKFGMAANYLRTANSGIALIAQLESVSAVAQLEAIGAVPGVDALFLGPVDLSASMGHVGQFTHPAVLEMMAQAVRRCKTVGKPVGTIGGTPEMVAQYRAIGFDFVAIASDLGLMVQAAQGVIASLRTQGSMHVHTLAGGTQTGSGQ